MICTNRSIRFELTSYVVRRVEWSDMILTFTYFHYNFAMFSMWHDMISWYHNMTCTYMHGRCRKRCDHCFSGLPKVAFLSLVFFKARQWTLCNDPLGPRSGNAKRQRCECFWFRCRCTVPTVSTTTRGLAVCTTRLASDACTLWYWKPKHWSKNSPKLRHVGHWKDVFAKMGCNFSKIFLNLLQVFGMEPLQELHYQRIWHWPCSLWQCKNCCWLVHLEGHSVASQQAAAEDAWGILRV